MPSPLTVAAVKKYRPTAMRREVRDGGAQGLYLVIQPSGAKSWCLRFRRPDGSPAKLTLGTIDLSGRELETKPEIGMPLSLPAARQLAAEVHRRRALGNDVVADYAAEKHRRRAEVQDASANTFGAAVRQFIDEYVMKKTRRGRQTARLLGFDVRSDGYHVIGGGLASRWADKPITQVTGHDVYSVVDEAKRRGIPGLGRRNEGLSDARGRTMARTLSKLFAWLVQHRKIDVNPCVGMYVPSAPAARDRVLRESEIASVWRACDSAGEPFGSVFKLLLLTGCRLNEVARMQRDEISEDGKTWTIPGTRTKNGRTHVVPLSSQAREIVIAQPTRDDSKLVFTTNGKTPVSGWSKVKKRLDQAAAIPPWRLHDLRRTAATGMAELGVPPHIVEAVLNHVSGAKAGVAGTYNRAAYAAEKTAALDRWAAHVDGLATGRAAKVLPMRRVP